MAIMRRMIDISTATLGQTRWRIVLLERTYTSQELGIQHSYSVVSAWNV
jgi:hypothetical protein